MMRKFWKYGLLAMLTCVLVLPTACEDESKDDPQGGTLKLEKGQIEKLEVGLSATVKILEGSGEFQAEVMKTDIAEASIHGSVVEIKGKKPGKTEVRIHDTQEKTMGRIQVEVVAPSKDMRLEKASIELEEESWADVKILRGSGSYKVATDNVKVAAGIVNGEVLRITSKNITGSAKITVTDSKTKVASSIKVTVIEASKVFCIKRPGGGASLTSITLKANTTVSLAVYNAGESSIEVEPGDEGIAKVSYSTATGLVVEGVKEGKTSATIKAVEKKESVKLTITVEKAEASALVNAKDRHIKVKFDPENKIGKKELRILKGNKQVEAVSSDKEVLEVTGASPYFTLVAKKLGKVTVTLTDKTTNQQETIEVEVIMDSRYFRIKSDESNPQIAELTIHRYVQLAPNDEIAFELMYGSGDYEIKNEHPEIATVAIEGSKVTISAKSSGNLSFIIKDKVWKGALGGSVFVRGKEIEWVDIPAGEFDMGVDFISDCKPVHKVKLSAFKMSKYEVTYEQFDAFCDAKGRPHLNKKEKLRGARAITGVTYEDALAYCEWANCSLPTEAQWEYACRADGSTPPEKPIWGSSTFYRRSAVVGLRPANAWGLYDMLGNVWEICHDWYAPYTEDEQTNPTGPANGTNRVYRGGSFMDNAWQKFYIRGHELDLSKRHNDVGFRVVKN